MKDRLIQTRVPGRIENVLKEEAQRRRLTVSHLIRNILEDTFQLVGDVVVGAGDIAKDSVTLAEQVALDAGKIVATVRDTARDAKKIVATARDAPPAEDKAAAPRDPSKFAAAAPRDPSKFAHVLAWNQVIANRLVECGGCGKHIPRGGVAHVGLSTDSQAPSAWLCPDCLSRL
ncbi:MAG TPA: hypothetical protein VHC69_35030 [Polyangiaceae bacterium]|nr:hypothetical protein [Polyangiaceae bacterium]